MPLAAESSSNSPVNRCKPKTNDGTKNLFICFRLLGHITPEKFQGLYVTYAWVLMAVTAMVPLSFGISFFKGSEKRQINNLLSSVQIYINTLSCLLRVIILCLNRKKIFKIGAIFDKLDTRQKYPEELKEAGRAIKFGNRMVILFLFIYFGYSTFTLMGAIASRLPPYGLYIPYLNWRDSTWNFAAVSAIEYISINVTIFQQLVNDVFPVIYVGIYNSHLEMLIMRVLRIGTGLTTEQKDNKTELVQCVLDHKLILQLISTIDPVLSATFFVQFTASTIAMCIVLVTITVSSDNATLFAAFLYFVGLLMETFFVCYFVTTLTYTSNRLPEAIFHMNWVEQDKEFRQLMLFFMQRSQQDITLFAGKLFPISLNTFLSMNKFAFSLYTMLNQMDVEKWFN